jgi:hypothetical protein
VIANPTPVALSSAIALAILIRLLPAVAITPARTDSPDVADRWPRSPRAMKRDRSHGWVAIVSVTSATGPSRPKWAAHPMSAFPPIATTGRTSRDVSKVPEADSCAAVSVIVAGLTRQGRIWPRHGKKQTSRKYEE